MSDAVIHSLEPHFYTGSDHYEREVDRLMAKSWLFAGHVSSLPAVGDYFAVELARESLFCVRSAEDAVKCYYNVCQHRGHQLVQGEGNARFIVCPYHSWTYELDGRFKSAPNLRVLKDFDRGSIRLQEVRVEVFCGFIFVNLDTEARPMGEWFPNVEAELRDYVPHIDRLKPVRWVEIPEKCNWKVSVENYSECYHCALNHPTFSTGVIKPETYDIQPQGYCLRHTTECQHLDKMSYPIDLDSNPHAGDYSSWFLWPMFSFQVYPGNVLNTYHWRPQGVDRVTVWRGWYTPDGEESEVINRLAQQDRETTVEEDIRIVESVQRGLGSRGYRPGPLVLDPKGGVNSEHSVYYLQKWMREAVEG